MNDRLLPKTMCSGSRDLFIMFWKISDNISETVQDRDIAAMEVYYEIVCGLSNCTIASDLV